MRPAPHWLIIDILLLSELPLSTDRITRRRRSEAAYCFYASYVSTCRTVWIYAAGGLLERRRPLLYSSIARQGRQNAPARDILFVVESEHVMRRHVRTTHSATLQTCEHVTYDQDVV